MLQGSVSALLQRQYGLIGDHQLVDQCSLAERRSIQRSKDYERVGPRVRRFCAVGPSVGQQLLAPVLDAGRESALCGYAACHWWGFGRFRAWPVHVCRQPRKLPRRPMARIHSTTVLAPSDVTTHRCIPILRPERLIFWLARMETNRWGPEIAAERLARVVDHAWREGLVDGHYIHDLAERCGGRGNSGIIALRTVLESRPPDYVPADSRLEERWEEVAGATAAQFERQVHVGGAAPIGRVDMRHVSRPIIVEVNSEKFHTTLTDVENDIARYAALVDAGFSVVIYWEFDIWHDRHTVRESLLQILAEPDEPARIHRPTPAPFALLR